MTFDVFSITIFGLFWHFLQSVHHFLNVNKDVISRPFGVDHLSVELLGHRLGFGIVIFNAFLDSILSVIKIIPENTFENHLILAIFRAKIQIFKTELASLAMV